MSLHAWDWAIVAAYIVAALGIGFYFSKRASKGIEEFFLSGRNLPWYVAGTSLVAATFSADTPLLIAGLVASKGLASNWFWWSLAIGGMITVFVYARLWRRSEVMTEFEMFEFRYSGKAASFLRGFRAIYVVFIIFPIAMGGITVAILRVVNTLVTPESAALAIQGILNACNLPSLAQHVHFTQDTYNLTIVISLFAFVGLYSTLAGSWGVVVVDSLQFCVAMAGCIALAFVSVGKVGGVQALQEKVAANIPNGAQYFNFLPDFNPPAGQVALYPLTIFFLMIFVQWWASSYASPSSGGADAMRMSSCKNEKHAFGAILWYQIAMFCLRPWPWIMVAFVAMAVIPDVQHLKPDPSTGYILVIKQMAPVGLMGLMFVTFMSAFSSTTSSILNAYASFMINDGYRRFVRPKAGRHELVFASRAASVFLVIIAIIASFLMREVTMESVAKVLAAIGAGAGTVAIMRWFWWRVNVWSEISAMIASFVSFVSCMAITQLGNPNNGFVQWLNVPEYQMIVIASTTIPTWLIVTFLTKPTATDQLVKFFTKIHPAGPGWGPIARLCPNVRADRNLGWSLLAAFVASGIIYGTLPGIGYIIFGEYLKAVLCFGAAILCGVLVAVIMRKIGWGQLIEIQHDAAPKPAEKVEV